MKKTIWFVILALVLNILLVGCGASQNAVEKAQEKALENALGDGSKVDIEGDKYTWEDADGNKMSVGGSEWPTGPAADILPKFTKGTMLVGMVTEQYCSISFEEITKKDFEDYRQQVKDAGFTNMASESSYEGSISYIGYLDETHSIQLYYDENENMLIIVANIDA